MWMELDGVECMSSSDGIDEDDATHHQLPFSKPHIINGNGNGNGTPVSPAIPPATSVHELLECPVCTNSMYPPIHQVGSFCSWSLLPLFFFFCSYWFVGWLVFMGFWWLLWLIGCWGDWFFWVFDDWCDDWVGWLIGIGIWIMFLLFFLLWLLIFWEVN